MRIESKRWRRLGDVLGAACLVATLSLLSPGVRLVRAEDEALMSVDPGLAAAAERAAAAPVAAPAYPVVPGSDVETARRPGVPGIESQPGVVVLNTRGFNYGPPPTPLSPEALRQESGPR